MQVGGWGGRGGTTGGPRDPKDLSVIYDQITKSWARLPVTGLLRSGGVVIARGVGVDSSDQRDRVRVLPSFEHPEASDGLCASVVCAAPCSAENAKKVSRGHCAYRVLSCLSPVPAPVCGSCGPQPTPCPGRVRLLSK